MDAIVTDDMAASGTGLAPFGEAGAAVQRKRSGSRGMGGAMNGGNPKVMPRSADDFYATPLDFTVALMHWLRQEGAFDPRLEALSAPERFWEPFCGDGAMARVLEKVAPVTASDLVDRGYGTGGVDFLTLTEAPLDPRRSALISNPPFDIAGPLIARAMALGVRNMALVLPANFWSAAGNHGGDPRDGLWNAWRPDYIIQPTWRPDFRNLGAPTMNVIWSIWVDAPDPGGRRTTVYERLHRPDWSRVQSWMGDPHLPRPMVPDEVKERKRMAKKAGNQGLAA